MEQLPLKVKVITFGEFRRVAGAGEREIELSAHARVADVARAVGIEEATGALAVLNGKTAHPDAEVEDGDEVAFFPRVAGGAV
ncbi:MAG: MoaD/ThiS family protein [Armatimonadota bacterium]|nr:MAG: MoaD/ThiS family protein [Armatimonadota bacterium]